MIPTRTTDQAFSALFSVSRPFSEHLTKREDDRLRDKYDHNSFFYEGQPSVEEVRQALAYQKARRDAFLKLEGYTPLEQSFGMEGEETLTMLLPENADLSAWKTNPAVSIEAPDFDQLEQNELNYHGAYLDGKLAGSCYTWSAGGYTCLDGLLVDSDFRHQYVASTLLKALAEQAKREGKILYLHADPEDTPKDMYAKMGFQVVDRVYEYLCTDFTRLQLD